MTGRLLFTGLVAFSIWAASSVLRRRQLASASRASRREAAGRKTPSIVYFWSNGCSACKRAQRPVLDGIVAELGSERVTLTAHCVDEAPEVAEAWGVKTLPTTFVLDRAGTVRHVNNGVIGAERLRRQLEALQPG